MSAKKLPEDTELKARKEIVVQNPLGIHARPAAWFVKTANRFDCNVLVEKGGETVNGKSIMGLMMLAAGPGSKLIVHCEGKDAARAVKLLDTVVGKFEAWENLDQNHAGEASKELDLLLKTKLEEE